MANYDTPSLDIAEITLIGTGGGYGESVVIHVGNNNWIIVDSCINPNTKQALPLEYLKNIGINLLNVKLIVCTHWHDDHILGLSQILSACPEADFSFARANDLKKFLHFIHLDHQKAKRKQSNSSTIEFATCLDILKKRGKQPKWAGQDRILFSTKNSQSINSEIISLSPSDLTMTKFDEEISTLITDFGAAPMKVIISSPNAKSVALFVKIGEHRALLGADLEISSNKNEGWDNVISNCVTIDKKASLIKIPHHGSKNGYHSQLWIQLLTDKPVAKLTPWNKNKRLPDIEMLKVYQGHTDKLFITSPFVNLKHKKRHPNTEKLLKQLNDKIKEVKFSEGIICSRILINDSNASWTVNTFSNAFELDKSETIL